MIRVYFESSSHAELVATFETDELYNRCLPTLEKEAERMDMMVTESMVDDEEAERMDMMVTESMLDEEGWREVIIALREFRNK
jgi:hypothetical protein